MPATYKKIASVTVTGSATSTIEFTSIPGTYTDLVLYVSARSSSTDEDVKVTFNTSGGTYTIKRLLGTGSATSSDSSPAQAYLRMNPSTDTASTFSNGILYIPNYTSSNAKAISGDSVTENNGTRGIQMMTAALWSGTDAITKITLTNQGSNNFEVNSTATLYGIKKY
jgi:hypothetical protein